MSTTSESRMGNSISVTELLLSLFSGMVVDAPVRLAVMLTGAWWCWRHRRGRFLLALGAAFLGITLVLNYVQAPVVDRVFALTYPWSNGYRLIMVDAVPTSLLGAAGLSWLCSNWRKLRPEVQRFARSGRLVLALLAVLAGAYVLVLPMRFAADVAPFRTYSPDDAAAMAWLSANVRPGDTVLNDAAADAGIWTPYKAGASILLPHAIQVPDAEHRESVRAHVGQLDLLPDLRSAACQMGVRYVYYGAASPEPPLAQRTFPPRTDLEQSSALVEVFSTGRASVFRVKC